MRQSCAVEIFAGLTNSQLEAFFFAHDTNYRIKTSLPAKGTLEATKTNTDPTKRHIGVVFDCRMMPNNIQENKPHDLYQVVEDDEVGSMHVHWIMLKDDKTILPSMLLSNKSWAEYAVDLLDLDKISTSSSELKLFNKEKADMRKLEG